VSVIDLEALEEPSAGENSASVAEDPVSIAEEIPTDAESQREDTTPETSEPVVVPTESKITPPVGEPVVVVKTPSTKKRKAAEIASIHKIDMKPVSQVIEQDEMFPESGGSWLDTGDEVTGSLDRAGGGQLDIVASERTVHAEFYNNFGDLFDDEDLS